MPPPYSRPTCALARSPHARCGSPRIKDWQAGTTGMPLIDAEMRELFIDAEMREL
ncbi:hypothetical protein M7M4_03450 [Corynebacterium pseudogenitalium]